MLAHLTDEKRKHSTVLWVNLQEELVLEGNSQVFTPREPSSLEQHIALPSADPALIEVRGSSSKEYASGLKNGALRFYVILCCLFSVLTFCPFCCNCVVIIKVKVKGRTTGIYAREYKKDAALWL